VSVNSAKQETASKRRSMWVPFGFGCFRIERQEC
jgi:hypothetical protein